MIVNRFREIKNSGDITFKKVVVNGINTEVVEYATYKATTQTELDFASEVLKRFDNAFPEWADILTWQIIAEDDLLEYIKDPMNTII